MNKNGRPIIGEAKNQNIKVRLDGNLFSELERYCDVENISKSDTIRSSIKFFIENNKKDSSTAK